MNTFHLRIVTMDGKVFDDQASQIFLRTIDGDVAIRAGHINYCSGIGMGQAHVTLADGHERYAACIGGMVSMLNGECQVAATTWEWKEEIDEERAKKAKERAEERLNQKNLSDREQRIAENAARGLGGALVEGARSEGERDGRAEEDRGGDGRGAREEVGAARRTEEAPRGAGAEGGAEVGALAVLHEDEHDDDDGGDDLQNESYAEKKMHG